MKKIYLIIYSAVSIFWIISCGPVEDYRQFTDRDISPPIFTGMGTLDPFTLELQFSEEVTVISDLIKFDPLLKLEDISSLNSVIKLKFREPLQVGNLYKIEITVEDNSGNSLIIFSEFYGYNPNLPQIVINEFTTQGSTTNPDKVELKVVTRGNTAGLCLFEGIDIQWSQRKIFPSINVDEGDYIIVHFKPSGVEEELDELISKESSGGLNVSPEAWDLWVENGTGLSGNNGTITLFSNPAGVILDGVLYSNRNSNSDENYRGFGSLATMIKADRLAELGEWNYSGELIAPEDAIDPEDSTATRSMCRSNPFIDTNSSTDWHIVPTSNSTFGSDNSNDEY